MPLLLESADALLLESSGSLLLESEGGATAMPGAICISDDVGTLTLDPGMSAISLNTFAYGIPDLSELISVFVTRGGDNVTMPEEPGRRAYPLELDQLQLALPFLISGVCLADGTPNTDDEDGLTTTLLYLRANVFRPPGAPTRAASLLLSTGASLTGPIQSVGFQKVRKERGYMSGIWTINVPLGELV